MTVRQIGQALRARQVSCVELVERTLAGAHADRFNSFLLVTADKALAEARERDRELAQGIDRGPFHGVPIAYKDLFYTRGIPTTGASLVYRDFVPDHDATVVDRFSKAGAISLGKTHLHELAYGITSKNPHHGPALNPRDPQRLAGGSSGGSAIAVAAGWVPVTLGTDTGGSIRIPASFCGITGLKPTYGRVSRYGVLPLGFSLDHVGPLGSCVEDCALAMNAIAGADPLDASSAAVFLPDFNLPALRDFTGVRVGVPPGSFVGRVDGAVSRAVADAVVAMERGGAALVDVKLPDLSEINPVALVVLLAEAAGVYAGHRDASLFGKDTWALLEQGRMIAAHEYLSAQRLRTLFRRDFDRLWQAIDVLAIPTTPTVAPLLTEDVLAVNGESENVRAASTRLVRAFNFLGEPALSMPCGQTAAGLPIGLQLIGAPFSEPRLLQIAKTLEPFLV